MQNIFKTKYGYFDLDCPGKYVITRSKDLKAPWEYIYQNRDILLYVDQNGPVKAQAEPPAGIMLFKREESERLSKWHAFIRAEGVNGGKWFTNYGFDGKPGFSGKGIKKEVEYTPQAAQYRVSGGGLKVSTKIFVPLKGCRAASDVTFENTSDKPLSVETVLSFYPYVNEAVMVPWDKPEWYLKTKTQPAEKRFCFVGDMLDPLCRKEKEGRLTFCTEYDDTAEYMLSLEDFCGGGDYFHPQILNGKEFGRKLSDCTGEVFSHFQAVYAVKYKFVLQPGGVKTIRQTMELTEGRLLQAGEASDLFASEYFSEVGRDKLFSQTEDFYNKLFTTRSIKTSDKLLSSYVNGFLPLQVYWAASLDRGWPTGMRGVRDCSNDFMGMLPLDKQWTREIIIKLLSYQRSDGWLPRQVCVVPDKPHDMRSFADGGAFLLELFNEYMMFTRDSSLLNERAGWLDKEGESTILDHILKCMDFYVTPENIGENGLCKVYYGDWWDTMDRIGLKGRGESVTITAQVVLTLGYMRQFLKWLEKNPVNGGDISGLDDLYLQRQKSFTEALNSAAYNKSGYYNGYLNDDGVWLMSDSEPDGVSKLFLVPNAWAMIARAADGERIKSVIDNIDKRNANDIGYLLFSKNYKKPVENAGRIGRGTSRTTVYNHAQAFYARGLLYSGMAEKAVETIGKIMPYNHDEDASRTPPYAVVNGYTVQPEAAFGHGGFQFLTGTTAMLLRLMFNFLPGIEPSYGGLNVYYTGCKLLKGAELTFKYLGREITVKYIYKRAKTPSVSVNGSFFANLAAGGQITIGDEFLTGQTKIEIILN